MKSILAMSAAILLAGSSVALAGSNKSDKRASAQNSYAQDSYAQAIPGQRFSQPGQESWVVTVGGQYAGKDPDVNVRRELERSFYTDTY
jgi:hypothetical protein